VPVVITTHDTQDAAMTRALERIGEIEAVIEPPRRIRVEAL
jgi:homoserine dehydrogenase